MDCRERRSHARCVYLTQDTLRMGSTRINRRKNQIKNNNSKREVGNMDKRNVRTKRKFPMKY